MSDVERVLAAARALVEKLDQVTDDCAGIFSFAAMHGYEYRGAQYGKELDDLRTLLEMVGKARG